MSVIVLMINNYNWHKSCISFQNYVTCKFGNYTLWILRGMVTTYKKIKTLTSFIQRSCWSNVPSLHPKYPRAESGGGPSPPNITVGAFLRYWVKAFYRGLRLSIEDREVEPDSLCEIPLELVCAQDQTLQTKRNMYTYMYIVTTE